MSEFSDTQIALERARQQCRDARRTVLAAREQLRKLKRQQLELGRHLRTDDSDQLEALRKEERELASSLERFKATEVMKVGELRHREKLFEGFSDPREHISSLSDQFPILLFPLRIETRFMPSGPEPGSGGQLWVRVYPDDIAVDSFEPLLTEVELSNARIYWTNIWKAGGDDGGKRAAWKSLAKSHGAGRAHWIVQQFEPTNLLEEPVKADGEYLLVIVTDQALTPAEKPTVQHYWRRVFLAGNDGAELDAALDELITELGQARADEMVSNYVPQNLSAKVAKPETITSVSVEFLELPSADQLATQQQAWANPASTALQPERFVVLGFNDEQQTLIQIGAPVPSELVIGPNPSAEGDQQFRVEDDELVVPDELKWMTDFDEAVRRGMGFRIKLSRTQFRLGFDRLFVIGVRMSADVETSTRQLEELIQNHQRSRRGLSILPQGTPTNNVEDETSGYTWRDDTDVSYEHFFVQDHSDDPTDWRHKKDGRWLAEILGVDPKVLQASPNYFATDQCEARAMNEALWPATLGYFMEQMMGPVFSEKTANSARAYFNRYVLGRGTIPAIRVGRQPYGIMPTTPFSRMAWLNRKVLASDKFDIGVPDQLRFLPRLYTLLKKVDESWSQLLASVSYVGKPGVDPHQALLDVIGLHPGSVEFYQRYAETYEQLYNRFKLSGAGAEFLAANSAFAYVMGGMLLLNELGYQAPESSETPEVLNKFFLQQPNLLKGPMIDDQPLSESDPVRAYREDGSNYIEWLISAVRNSHDTLRKQDGFTDDRPPRALLYQMLRHALDLGFVETSIQLHLERDLLTAEQARIARREPKFFHIQETDDDQGSPWQYLYKAEAAITGDAQLRIADFIPQILSSRDPYLNTQLKAMEHLQHVPTARLERAYAEHIDCCSYRLDSWWLGLLNVQLSMMRSTGSSEPDTVDDGLAEGRGCYLGAFGWVEDLQPDYRQLEQVELDEELDRIFNKPDQPPLGTDSENFGYIHAPSLDHAVTAAVLRNGYLANATPDNPESLSINLTSERVRLAMGLIEGIRNGQSLAALLGYQLERGLHDRDGLFLDSIIFELRKQFPLVANRFANTRTDKDISIESIEARNVVDGLALLEHVQNQSDANQGYPFGLSDELPEINDLVAVAAIDEEVQRIANINDAVADLAMAESVYQVVRGNYDRAGSALDAYSKGHFPPIPEVVQTPRSGVTLTHRVGLHFRGDVNPDDPLHSTPRAKGEPAINLWLTEVLPLMSDIYCMVDFFNHSTDTSETVQITAADLGLQAIDLLYMVKRDTEQEMQALDDRIVFHMLNTPGLRPDGDIKIRYRDKQAGRFSFFEITPYVIGLRALLLRSRPLRATDTRMPNEASKTEEASAQIRPIKVTRVSELLSSHNATLSAFIGDIDLLLDGLDETVVNNAVDNIDIIISTFSVIADQMNRFGLPGTGIGFAWDWRRAEFSSLVADLEEVLERWNTKLDDFDTKIVEFDNLPSSATDEEKTALLLKAGLLISTDIIILPAPGDPLDLRNELDGARKTAFKNVRDDLATILSSEVTVSGFYKALLASAVDMAAHDTEVIDLEKHRTAIVAFAKKVQTKSTALSSDITSRLATAATLTADDPESSAADRIDAFTQAVRKMTSEDFVILPEFTLQSLHAAEWQNAFDNQSQLTDFLRTDAGIDFPVDDWLYGVARVRDKLRHIESATMFAEAFGSTAPTLTPLQFPYRADDAWLALKIPDKIPGTDEPFVIDEDKLLYTAHYQAPFNSSELLHCGVLIDEWTEVIPTREESTGLAFHYDRPNTEPPQSLLLALPANFTGQWQWQDLVDTLHETLDFARKRAVEPQHLDGEDYARFLPAIISSVTRFPVMHSLDFSFNNAVQFKVEKI